MSRYATHCVRHMSARAVVSGNTTCEFATSVGETLLSSVPVLWEAAPKCVYDFCVND